ncbi:unnamed protein product [Penicillium bialowiezense]
MDKRRPRSSRIRLVRYIPETETCVHSRCPTPYPNRDTAVCTCGSRCEIHSPEPRAPSPTSSVNSSFEPALRCKSCGGFHILKQEPSPQVERLVCSCSRREIYIKEVRPRSPSKSLSSSSDYNSRCGCDKCRGVENRRERPREPRPISPTSSDSSNYGRTAGSRGRRTPARRPDTAPGAERPREAPTPPMTPAPSAKPTSTRPSTTTLHAAPIIHHHCSQAAYCEEHPEFCRVMPSPVPMPPSMRTQSGQSTPKSQQAPGAGLATAPVVPGWSGTFLMNLEAPTVSAMTLHLTARCMQWRVITGTILSLCALFTTAVILGSSLDTGGFVDGSEPST